MASSFVQAEGEWPAEAACTDTWTPTSLDGTLSGRFFFSAVWTGTEMIVWGGYDNVQGFDTGALYNPETDTWRPMTTVGAPASRFYHTAVWTGKEMLVWGGGGVGGARNDGGRYDPKTDIWRPMTTANARRAATSIRRCGQERR